MSEIKFGTKENYFYGALLYDEPKVIWCKTWSICDCTKINPIVEKFSNIEVIWLVSVGWMASEAVCKSVEELVSRTSKKHKVIFLVNSYEELNILKKKNIDCMLANQNQFLNKKEFCILNNVSKKYKAVYNAGFYKYKRHFLCQKVNDLSLISRDLGDMEVLDFVKNTKDFNLLNFDGKHHHWMCSKAVNIAYNESYCGLCLSKTEGAMKACMEYLLSGIPVVTTVNKGGRDFFLDGRFTIWVDDDPQAVLDAVDCFVENKISPEFIRDETIKKISSSNEIFIQEISAALGLSESKLKLKLSQYDFNISDERCIDEF
jgi:hypothetical protein